jgi:hypothetical protein
MRLLASWLHFLPLEVLVLPQALVAFSLMGDTGITIHMQSASLVIVALYHPGGSVLLKTAIQDSRSTALKHLTLLD